MQRRQRRAQTLQRRHQQLMAGADKLREEIEALGGTIATATEPRAPRTTRTGTRSPGGLVAALKISLAGEALTVSEAARKVIEQGYQSTSPNFRQIVTQTLGKSDQFERVGRGLYKTR